MALVLVALHPPKKVGVVLRSVLTMRLRHLLDVVVGVGVDDADVQRRRFGSDLVAAEEVRVVHALIWFMVSVALSRAIFQSACGP